MKLKFWILVPCVSLSLSCSSKSEPVAEPKVEASPAPSATPHPDEHSSVPPAPTIQSKIEVLGTYSKHVQLKCKVAASANCVLQVDQKCLVKGTLQDSATKEYLNMKVPTSVQSDSNIESCEIVGAPPGVTVKISH